MRVRVRVVFRVGVRLRLRLRVGLRVGPRLRVQPPRPPTFASHSQRTGHVVR